MSSSHESQPSARPSISEPPQQDAITLFDLHLKFLTESYLTFFLERRKIEEQYVEALLRLHRKVKATDTVLDDPGRGDLSTTRAAWNEIRDNVAREADTRVAFLGALTADVINPLVILRGTQDRIRKRIKEDLKDAVNTHTDYSENVLPRFKRNYLKKCQEAEDYKVAMQINPQSPISRTDPHAAFAMPGHVSASKPNPVISARPAVITAPQPLRPLERRPSVSATPYHARSPSTSTSTALQDLAHQGKRQLNQLMTFLDKGGNMKDLAGRSDNALKTVRAKREADEADKEYRKGVHWLETLRLRRVKILESSYNSLEVFVRENAETMRAVLQRYTDNVMYCYLRHPITDIAIIGYSIPRLLAAAIPKPVYYHNYNVGECKDLIFGVTLVDYATARNLPGTEGEQVAPKIVRICIAEIEKRGMASEGIYRVSGKHAAVRELQHKIERNEAAFQFNPVVDDVYAVASLLKLYLRELPEPLFRFPLQERLAHSEDLDEHRANDFQLLRGKIRRLPPVHYISLKLLIEHLATIASYAEKNKMDAKNLAIVFGAVIFGEDEMPKTGGDLLSVQSWKDTLCEDLILNAHILFQATGSPQLPPAAPDSVGAPIPVSPSISGSPRSKHRPTLGQMGPPPLLSGSISSRTRLGRSPSLPPTRSPPYTPIIASARSPPPEDFRPQLPPHPPASIHPALRSAGLPPSLPMSQRPVRQSLPVQPRASQPGSPPSFVARETSGASLERRTPRLTPRTQVRELDVEEPPSPTKARLHSPTLPPRTVSPAASIRTGESSTSIREEEEGIDVHIEEVPVPASVEARDEEILMALGSPFVNTRPESRQSTRQSLLGTPEPWKSPVDPERSLPGPGASESGAEREVAVPITDTRPTS